VHGYGLRVCWYIKANGLLAAKKMFIRSGKMKSFALVCPTRRHSHLSTAAHSRSRPPPSPNTSLNLHPVRLDLSGESAAIQQCFSLTTNQQTVLSA
jgi:hypothetical protein